MRRWRRYPRVPSSETLQLGEGQLPGVHVHGAEFGAAVQGRDVLAGVEQAAGIEGRLDRVEQGQLVAVELGAHLVDFLPADPVFAGDAAADRDAQLEDLAAQGFGAVQFAGLVGVEQDQRVHVAVAGMEHVGHPQLVFGGQRGDGLEHPRQCAARDGAVHAVVVRRQPAHRREGVLAPGPETHPLGFVAGLADLDGTGPFEHRADPVAVVVDIGFDTVQLAQQDGLGVHRVAGVNEVLGGADRQVVHHLQAAGNDAGGDDIGHRAAGFFHRVEGRQQHLGQLRLGQQLDRDFGDDPEQAFGTGEQRQQVETGRIQGVATEGQAFAFDAEDLHLEQVVHGQAVFQAVHAAGVFRDIAADGTGDLRRRVGGVVQAERRGSLGDRQVAHPGLDPRGAGGGVDMQDLVEARHHQQHALFQGQGAAGQAGAGTPGDHRHAAFMADPQQFLHLLDMPRQSHQHRRGAVGRKAVAFVGFEVFALVQEIQVGQALAQYLEQCRFIDCGQRAVDAFVVEDIHGWLTTLSCFYGRSADRPLSCIIGPAGLTVHGAGDWSNQFVAPAMPGFL
ncbi:hypothetical protein EMIT0373P_20256 [Pseudomonas chlororaphis]